MGQVHNFLSRAGLPASGRVSANELDPEVARHIAVLRIRAPEPVRFLDGRGGIFDAVCVDAKAHTFEITGHATRPPIAPAVELCLAPPRGDALKEAITQATEIGVASVRFIKSEFTQYASGQNAPADKMRKVSDAACEQCTRAWRCDINEGWHEISACLALPGIHVVADESLASSPPDAGEGIGFAGALPDLSRLGRDYPIRLYIGPEGGWSERERRLFDGKATSLSLGSLILRVPTAVVAATHFLRTVYWHARSR